MTSWGHGRFTPSIIIMLIMFYFFSILERHMTVRSVVITTLLRKQQRVIRTVKQLLNKRAMIVLHNMRDIAQQYDVSSSYLQRCLKHSEASLKNFNRD